MRVVLKLCASIICVIFVLRVVVLLGTAWRNDYNHHMLTNNVDCTASDSQERIPQIVHHTWKDENIPDDWIAVQQHCYDILSKHKRMFWTNRSARTFIESEYPWFLSTYDSYLYDIQRADVIRYFVLYKYGGIYLDLDVGCRRRFDSLQPCSFILPETAPVGFSNDVMMSKPGHQFLAYLISNLTSWNYLYGTKYLTVFFSTGPAFVSYHVNVYLSRLVPNKPDSTIKEEVLGHLTNSSTTLDLEKFRHQKVFTDPVLILNHHLYSNNKEFSYFYHVEGSSWHSWDALIVIAVYNRWKAFSLLAVWLGIGYCWRKELGQSISTILNY